MSLVFYYAPWSTASTTHWVLEELGVPYEKVHVDITKGEQNAPAYRALNPNGRVPLLVHDGVPIPESAAIALYLGETFGTKRGLFPEAGPARGLAMSWLVWCNVTLVGTFQRVLHLEGERVPADQRNAKAAERARDEVKGHLRVLDDALEGKTWVLGEDFSLVDVQLASAIGWMASTGFDLARFPRVAAWVKRATERPASVRVNAAEAALAA